MTVEEIHEMWSKDGQIDMTHISRESANIPFLHNKYFTKYTNEYLKLKKYRADYKKLQRDKDLYYRGILDPEELKALGWKPCALKLRPSELPKQIENDEDIINYSLKIGYQESIVEFLESIIKMINNRGFQLKTIVDYEKFKNGSN